MYGSDRLVVLDGDDWEGFGGGMVFDVSRFGIWTSMAVKSLWISKILGIGDSLFKRRLLVDESSGQVGRCRVQPICSSATDPLGREI